jgi:hypothetical protein
MEIVLKRESDFRVTRNCNLTTLALPIIQLLFFQIENFLFQFKELILMLVYRQSNIIFYIPPFSFSVKNSGLVRYLHSFSDVLC